MASKPRALFAARAFARRCTVPRRGFALLIKLKQLASSPLETLSTMRGVKPCQCDESLVYFTLRPVLVSAIFFPFTFTVVPLLRSFDFPHVSIFFNALLGYDVLHYITSTQSPVLSSIV